MLYVLPVGIGCPLWLSCEESACNVGDLGLIPGLGRSPGEGTSYPLQYSGLEKSMDRGAWQTTVHWVAGVGHDLATFTFTWNHEYVYLS